MISFWLKVDRRYSLSCSVSFTYIKTSNVVIYIDMNFWSSDFFFGLRAWCKYVMKEHNLFMVCCYSDAAAIQTVPNVWSQQLLNTGLQIIWNRWLVYVPSLVVYLYRIYRGKFLKKHFIKLFILLSLFLCSKHNIIFNFCCKSTYIFFLLFNISLF